MPIYYPQNLQKILTENLDQAEDIKANYNLLFNKKESSLKQKYQKEFDKIINTSRSHATLLSDFLKPFISDKNNLKYMDLQDLTLLLLDPLYSDYIKGLKTFDAIVGCLTNEKINRIFLIEAKSSKVDDEYKEYDEYHEEKIKELIIKKLKERYPQLKIDPGDFEIQIFVLVYEKHLGSWKTSLEKTGKDIILWSRTGKDPLVNFKIGWKKNAETENCLGKIETFFENNEILKTTEFEMSFSLDNLYNLDVLRKNYRNKYQNGSINFELCQSIFKKIAKSDYFERGNTEKIFFQKLIKIGLDYDVVYKKDLKSFSLFFREGEDILKNKYVEKKLNENLYSNETNKNDLLTIAVNSCS
jgi:hypothetical protein